MCREKMFGVAVAVAPVFARNDVFIKVSYADQLISQVLKQCPLANAIYVWRMPRAYSNVVDIELDLEDIVREYLSNGPFHRKSKKLINTRKG